ncbi:hypothetical protein [Paraglaciecola aestuariivivens]
MLNIARLAKLFSLPFVFYALFIAIRISGAQPTMESELGDFITSIYFLFGAFVSYFIYVLKIEAPQIIKQNQAMWWWLMCLLLVVLALDELYMIHEFLGEQLKIKDTFIFLFYALLLGLLLLCRLADTFTKNTFVFLILFTICTVLSQLADFLYNEGTVVLFNRDISYEQFLESFGALFLSCAVATIAIREVTNREEQ